MKTLTILSVLALAPSRIAMAQVTITAAPGTVQIAPGQTVNAWMYDGQLPGPTIRVTQGQTVQVHFVNGLPEESTIHWHGLAVPTGMDGVPGVSQPPVPPGGSFDYSFVATTSGTYWFHPHVGLQLDRGLYGTLIVDPATPVDPPFDREYQVVLDDWLPGAPVPGQDPVYSSYLINGRTSAGQAPLLVNPGEKVRLRFLNAGAGTIFVVAVDGHLMSVTHADGHRVQPVPVQALTLGPGERYDVLIDASNAGTWSIAAASAANRNVTLARAILQYGNSTQAPPSASYVPPWLATGNLLGYHHLAAAGPVPPIAPIPDRTFNVQLSGGMMNYVWTINGQAWPNADPFTVQYGESVRMTMSTMGMSMMHPMHIHGHFFRLIGTAGGNASPPMKDTILVGGMMGTQQADFLADNPGDWMYHCHNLYHAEAGMMRLIEYQTATPFCFGDGSGTACPCANPGSFGHGCENSFATGGGLLGAEGTPSTVADTVVLQASGLPPTSVALFFQGDAQQNGGLGVVSGDGLLCAGGNLVRMGARAVSGGSVSFGYGIPGDPLVSVAGAVPAAGATRHYQAWYRNPQAYCTSATWNLTNGTTIRWRP